MSNIKLDIKIDKKNNKAVIKNIYFFDLFKTLESGQTFRYRYIDENDKTKGVYVCNKNIITLLNENINEDKTCDLIIHSCDKNVINEWIDYFNLTLDYKVINNDLIKIDKNMKKMIDLSNGVRIIHSDLWESIITFIISENNNMKRIKYSVNLLSEKYGKLLLNDKDNKIKIYEIPDSKKVSKLSLDEIRNLKVGFRDKYILDAAEKISSKEINLDEIKNMNSDKAKFTLMQIKGIGDKVASCINLFALNNFESFPVDTWIEKYMNKFNLKENKKYERKEIEYEGIKTYGKYAGIAQQYMFYYCINVMKNE